MTCIYDAWAEALKIGHNQIQLKKEPVFQQTIFDEYIHVDQDLSKAEKVIKTNRESVSKRIIEQYKEPTLKEIIKLIILDVIKNENVRFSDITYNGGGFSRILLIGDKVIKLGDRVTKSFPNNPYIVAPLLRQEFAINNEKCFAEVTERVDTSIKPSKEELYQLYKKIRNLGLKWTDIKETNVGRLKKKNIIHWQENLNPTEETLGLGAKRGKVILEKGELVILDADFIYDENDLNINYTNNKPLYDEFEKRYQAEKKELKQQEAVFETRMAIETNVSDYDISEHRGLHR